MRTVSQVVGFSRLLKKLKAANTAEQFFDYMGELYVCHLFLSVGCSDINLGLEDSKHKRPDLRVQVARLDVNVEVTRIHAPTNRQVEYNRRIKRIVERISRIPSSLYIAFYPYEEYDDAKTEEVAEIIERKIAEYLRSDLTLPVESFVSLHPGFSLHTSLKGPVLSARPETVFRVESFPVFLSGAGAEERRIQDALAAKYAKFKRRELNLLVILLTSAPLEETAQEIGNILGGEDWENLSVAVLKSYWPGRSRVFQNANAVTPAPGDVLAVLEEFGRL